MAKFAIYNGETFEREVEVTERGAFIGGVTLLPSMIWSAAKVMVLPL